MPIRLIDTETLKMRFFNSSVVPKYAILSHTWVEDEEISLQEMCAMAEDPGHAATQKSGYEKIVETCLQARAHGLQYAWVDTCCIDKSSSAELSEAINSMFRWYQESEVCFAFLSDLPADIEDIETALLQGCRWFNRGWCLQELIAPRNVNFYDEAWNCRGSKSEHKLRTLVSTITGIGEDVLKDSSLIHSIPVARRMRWASERVTTRVEDIAYCLLGIFDVNMPMLYGEGHKAFMRLQEEIIKRSSDMSTFLFLPSPSLGNRESYIEDPTNAKADVHVCDMFARSPAAFIECDSLMRWGQEDPFDAQDFQVSMTNRGVYLGKQTLNFFPHHRCFALRHKYEFLNLRSENLPARPEVFLRKIGGNLFVRCQPCWPVQGQREPAMIDHEMFILSRATPSIKSAGDIRSALNRALRFQLKSYDKRIHVKLGDPSPQDRWDCSNTGFLLPNAFHFHTRIAIHWEIVDEKWSSSNRQSHTVWLLCEVRKVNSVSSRRIKYMLVESKPHGENLFSMAEGKFCYYIKDGGVGPFRWYAPDSTSFTVQISRDGDDDSDCEIYTCAIDIGGQ
ncbi:Vegetative incompatibility protein HET-E-1 [Colletotrichum viniferum]|nr:Vegetative incompatibility protein HET-E-1 [Colletotrichum viniferum]